MAIDIYGRQIGQESVLPTILEGGGDFVQPEKKSVFDTFDFISTAQADETEDSAALQREIRNRRAAEAAERRDISAAEAAAQRDVSADLAVREREQQAEVDIYGRAMDVYDVASRDPFLDYLKNTAANTGSTLLDILHQLGRPQSAVMTGFKYGKEALERKQQAGEDTGVRVPIFGGLGIQSGVIPDVLEGIKKGFSYEDETRAKDLMNQDFVKNHPVASSILGFMLDVATDPLTFGAAKAFTVPVGFTAKQMVKLGGKSEYLSNVGQRMSASQIADALNIHIGDAKQIKKMSDAFRDRLKGSHQKAEEFIKMRQLEIQNIAEKAGVSVDDLNKAILHDIEKGALGTADSLTAGMGDDAVRIATEDDAVYKELLRMEQDAGINISDVLDRASDLGIDGYIPHVVTQAARRKMGGVVSQFKRTGRPLQETHILKRKVEGTVEEINENMMEAMKGGKFMHDDPAFLRAIRTSRNAHEMAYVNFNNAARDMVGRTADEFPKGVVPSNFKPVKDIVGAEGEQIFFPEHIARTIKRQRDILRNTTELDKALKYFDNVQGVWKMWTLAIRPAYHMRNVAGNLWNAYTVAGVKNPLAFDDARKMQTSALFRDNPEMARQLGMEIGPRPFKWDAVVKGKGGVEKTYKEIYDQAVERGVLGKGQYGIGSDIQFNLERQLEKTAGTGKLSARDFMTPTGENVLLQQGFKIGNMLEDNARLGVFLDVFRRTGSFDEAASMTKRALFDYSDLSAFERTAMKRAFPFYTWTRKNIPAQMRALWENPERARKLDIARQQVEYEEGRPDPQNVYDFYNRGVPIYMSKEDKGEVWKMYRMLNYLPVADLERLHDPRQMLLEMATPVLKKPAEQLWNYDSFRNKQIEQYKGETTDFLGVRMPVHMANFAQLLVPIAEFNRANPFGMFGEATKDDDTGEWIRTKSWGMDQPLAEFKIPEGLPVVGGQWAVGGTPRESTRDQPAGIRLLQYSLGLRPYYVSEGEGRIYNIKAFNKDKNSLKYYLRQAIRRGQSRRAQEVLVLLEQWEAAQKQAELEKAAGKEPQYEFRGSRYYE